MVADTPERRGTRLEVMNARIKLDIESGISTTKLIALRDGGGEIAGYKFWCPGCNERHSYATKGDVTWDFNGNVNSPTFTPSLLYPDGRCHLYLTDGVIHFLQDCSHPLAGQSIPLPDYPL